MYSTCLFCHGDLGRNEVIEHFTVGRRLAFDGAKGRLWVVCARCERWNLTPLEDRWEAIEECERAFRSTKLRVSTEHIGMARLREGLELVRIGEPQRPEMAAWRYGDQFGRRRRKKFAMIAGGAAVVGGILVAGPALGLFSGVSFNGIYHLGNAANAMYRSRKRIHIPMPHDELLYTKLSDLGKVRLLADNDGVRIRFPVARAPSTKKWWQFDSEIGRPPSPYLAETERKKWYEYSSGGTGSEAELAGEDAVKAAGAILPHLNAGGGSKRDVEFAVSYLEDASDTQHLFGNAVKALKNSGHTTLKKLPTSGRLALEMAAHEDTERRALEGELYLLEEAWKDAEEIAAIADDLLIPDSVNEEFERLKSRDEPRSLYNKPL